MHKYFLVIGFAVLIGATPSIAKAKKHTRIVASPKTQAVPSMSDAEIKVLIQESEIDTFLTWVKNQNSTFEQEHVFFFELPNQTLVDQGLIIRLTRKQNDTYEASVKIRADEIKELPGLKPKSQRKLSCEIDHAFQIGSKKSCELTETSKKVLQSIDTVRIESLLSQDQMKLAKFFVSDLKWGEVKPIGRIISSTWKLDHKGKTVVCELWTLPNTQRVLECSTRTPSSEIESTQKDLVEFVSQNGLHVSPKQAFKCEVAVKNSNLKN